VTSATLPSNSPAIPPPRSYKCETSPHIFVHHGAIGKQYRERERAGRGYEMHTHLGA
jgi:hypothetical protein